jgi:hypothetical protein
MTTKQMDDAVSGSSRTSRQRSAGKSKPVFNMELFVAGVLGTLETDGIIKETDSPDLRKTVYDDVTTMWIASQEEPRELTSYDNTVFALTAFQEWFSTSEYKYIIPRNYVITTVAVTLTIGAASGTISVTATATPLSYETPLVEVFYGLKDELQEAITKWRMDTTRGNPTEKPKNDDLTTKKDHGETLVVTNRDGKLAYAVRVEKDARWNKFGIALYSDVVRDCNLALPKKVGEYNIDWDVVIEYNSEGKPRRIKNVVENEDVSPF